jgi:hypothetical protein
VASSQNAKKKATQKRVSKKSGVFGQRRLLVAMAAIVVLTAVGIACSVFL